MLNNEVLIRSIMPSCSDERSIGAHSRTGPDGALYLVNLESIENSEKATIITN